MAASKALKKTPSFGVWCSGDETLHFSGKLENSKLYVLQDSVGGEFGVIAMEKMEEILSFVKDFECEKYMFSLEQEVYKSMPVDFDDVWCIALQKAGLSEIIAKNRKNTLKTDPKNIVKAIKKANPHLFLDLDALKRVQND